MLIQVDNRLFSPKQRADEYLTAARSQMLCMLALPVGILTFASAFLVDASWNVKAILLTCGLITNVVAFTGWRFMRKMIKRAMSEYSTARLHTMHMITMHIEEDDKAEALLKDIAKWSSHNDINIFFSGAPRIQPPAFRGIQSNSRGTGYVYWFSFDCEDNQVLFKLKFT